MNAGRSLGDRTIRFVRRHACAARRSWETDESYWFWTWGRWQFSAGLFKGFGLGFVTFGDEWAFELGVVGLHVERVDA
jgi:hypothetical protein